MAAALDCDHTRCLAARGVPRRARNVVCKQRRLVSFEARIVAAAEQPVRYLTTPFSETTPPGGLTVSAFVVTVRVPVSGGFVSECFLLELAQTLSGRCRTFPVQAIPLSRNCSERFHRLKNYRH